MTSTTKPTTGPKPPTSPRSGPQPPSTPKSGRQPPTSPKSGPRPPTTPKSRGAPPPSRGSPKSTPRPPTTQSPKSHVRIANTPKSSLKIQKTVSLTTSTTTTTATTTTTTTTAFPHTDSSFINEVVEHTDEEYFVTKINKFGKSQNRIIRIKVEEKSFLLIDSKNRKQIKELKIASLIKIDIPPAKQTEKMSPLNITFAPQTKQRPFHLFFSDVHERMHFVQGVAVLNPSIEIHDKSAAECSKNFLKFSVIKKTKSVNKPRIITLLTKELELQHFRRSKKPYRRTHMSRVIGVSRNRINKCQVDIVYDGGADESFIFTDPAFRERFLGRFIQLWAAATSVRRSSQVLLDPFVEADPMSVLVTSWNAGESKPPSSERLTTWLGNARVHDLYAIGLQECSKSRDKWIQAILAHVTGIGQPNAYTVVSSVRLWDIMLIVIIKTRFMKFVKYVEKDTVACGKAGVLGNKGGAAIGFTIRDTSICFINSHLAARAERLGKRENDYKKIIEKMKIGIKDIDILNQYNHVIWCGDLNYRIEKDWDDVLEWVKNENWIQLAQCDQLVGEMAEMKVFVKFTEGSLDFAPTYRWEREENTPSNKRRQPPSWTDRILWRSFPNSSSEFEFHTYSSQPNVFGSDHRPVYATFTLTPRLPYQGDKLFHSSHRGAERHKHHTIVIKNLVMEDQSVDGDVDAQELSIIFSSTVLENKVTSPPFVQGEYVWKLDKNVQLTPFIRDEGFLRNSHLLLTVISKKYVVDNEEDLKEMKDAGDSTSTQTKKYKVIGSGVLSINKAFELGTINCLMTLEGQVTMQLKGNMSTIQSGFIDPEELGLSYLESVRPGFHISRRPEDMMAELRNEMIKPSLSPSPSLSTIERSNEKSLLGHTRQSSSPAHLQSGSQKTIGKAARSNFGSSPPSTSMSKNSVSVSSVAGNSPQLLSTRLLASSSSSQQFRSAPAPASSSAASTRGPPPPVRQGLSSPDKSPSRKSGELRIL